MKRWIWAALVLGAAAVLPGWAYLNEMRGDIAMRYTPEAQGSAGGLGALLLGRADYVAQTCCTHSKYVGQTDTGKQAVWFEIRETDPKVKGSNRSELRFLSNDFNEPVGFDADIHIPANWAFDATPTLAMQWHAARDRHLGEGGRVPPLELVIEGDHWIVRVASDPKLLSKKNAPPAQIDIVDVPMVAGKTSTWQFDVIWSATDTGRVQVRHNGGIVADYKGPTAHRDLIGPYLKFGVYSPKWKSTPAPAPRSHRIAFERVLIREGNFK